MKVKPRATKLVSDPYDERDGVYFSQADLKKLTALPAGTKLYILADVLAALREPSEAMYRATDGLGDAYGYNHKTKRAEVTYETIQSLWKAMLDQFEKEQK